MSILQDARAMRAVIEQAAASLDDKTASTAPALPRNDCCIQGRTIRPRGAWSTAPITGGGEYIVASNESYSHAMCEHEVEFAQKLAEIDSRSKSNTKRLDRLEELTETVHELAMTMKLMAEKQDRTAETVERLDTKLSAIEQEPAKRWKSIVDKAILTVVAALVGFALAQIGIT